jgi:predicted secreted protein
MALNGNLLILKMNGEPVAAVKGNDIETASGLVEVASATQGQWREYICGRKTWAMSATWLLLSSAAMASTLQVGQVFNAELVDRRIQNRTVYGNAHLEVCKIQATKGNLVTGVFQLKGTAWLRPTYEYGDFNNDFNNDFYNY